MKMIFCTETQTCYCGRDEYCTINRPNHQVHHAVCYRCFRPLQWRKTPDDFWECSSTIECECGVVRCAVGLVQHAGHTGLCSQRYRYSWTGKADGGTMSHSGSLSHESLPLWRSEVPEL